MKVPSMLKISMVLLGLGGILALTPSARAQSEVSPDHFDGTDSWAIALAAKDRATKGATSVALMTKQAKGQMTVKNAALHGSRNREVAQTQPAAFVTVEKKQAASSNKPKDQKN